VRLAGWRLVLAVAALGFGPGLHAVAHAQPAFAQCLRQMEPQAVKAGVQRETYRQLTDGLQARPELLERLDTQPEFRTPIWDYLAALVDDERVTDGRQQLAQWAEVLAEVSVRHGVDPATVVAVWGVESNYGRQFGKHPLLPSLATLACEGRRQAFFRGELFAALKIVQRGDLAVDQLEGSWAGAFGHTQFMPSTYLQLAVDFDGDGRRDLVASIPDALASTANFLQRNGWQRGQLWGFEVSLPAGFDASQSGRRLKKPLADWARLGVTRANGAPLTEGPVPAGEAALLLPAGAEGPAFAVFRNFDVIFRYNAAESYALAIAHLADRLRGGRPFVRAWPTDDPGLSRAQRRELQTVLLQRGHDIGAVDGMLGIASKAAIRLEQERLGMTPDGRAGQRLLQRLRERP
jgi:lytic murein transglycosylase